MGQVKSGLDVLLAKGEKEPLNGRISYLCHAASLTSAFSSGPLLLKKMLGKDLVSLMCPQHGLVTDVQDNMVETASFHHAYFDLPCHSLYGKSRTPTEQMLKDVDTVVFDLQDVGCRVYTYISTLTLLLRACAGKGIKVVVLDRPNPVSGTLIEGNILDDKWNSFVGLLPIPMRHGMTAGEIGHFTIKHEKLDIEYEVVTMEGWQRDYFWSHTGRAWVNPSPNLSTVDSAITFCGTVLFEGTNMSEGRGTTRALEMVGAPGIEPFSLWDNIAADFKNWGFEGLFLRPVKFEPSFQKHAGKSCGGFQIHVTDPSKFLSWRLGQWLMSKFHTHLKEFSWHEKPYEYEYDRLAIDMINGTDKLRLWCQNDASLDGLVELEQKGRKAFEKLRSECLIY